MPKHRPTWQGELDYRLEYNLKEAAIKLDSLVDRAVDILERFLTDPAKQLAAASTDEDVQLIEDPQEEAEVVVIVPEERQREQVVVLFNAQLTTQHNFTKVEFKRLHIKCFTNFGHVYLQPRDEADQNGPIGPLLTAERDSYRRQFRLLLDRFLDEAKRSMAHILEQRDRDGIGLLGPRKPCTRGQSQFHWSYQETDKFQDSEQPQKALRESKGRFLATLDEMFAEMRTMLSAQGYNLAGFRADEPIDID